MGEGVLLAAAAMCLCCVAALDNGVATTPPMGWSTWNAFGVNINESIIKATADAMVSSGMREAGYRYINIDDKWASSRDANGTLVPDPEKFPSGMKSLADYVHSKGLLLGLYTDVGEKTCAGQPGSYRYECHDANTFAAWGIDFLKEDHCALPNTNMSTDEFYVSTLSTMRDCLNNTGRPIFFDLCVHTCYGQNGTSHGQHNPDCWAAWYKNASVLGNSWRTTTDIRSTWDSVLNNWYRNNAFQDRLSLAQFNGPSHWNDPDCLLVGQGPFTLDQQRLQFSMWCMMASPLLAGNNLLEMSKDTVTILTQDEMIAVNQDPLGIQATRVEQNGKRIDFHDVYGDILTRWEQEVWVKPLEGGDLALALVNHNSSPMTIVSNFSAIAAKYPGWMKKSSVFYASQVWVSHNIGLVSNTPGQANITLQVPASGVAVVILRTVAPSGVPLEDDFTTRNTSLWHYSDHHAGWTQDGHVWVWMLQNHTAVNATLSRNEGFGLQINCSNVPCNSNPEACQGAYMASGLLGLLPENTYGDWELRYRAPYGPNATEENHGNAPDMLNSYFTAAFKKTSTYWNEINFGFRNYIPGKEGQGPNSQYISCELQADTGPYQIKYIDVGFNFRLDFHTYKITNRPGKVTWSVDGKEIYSLAQNATNPMQGLLSIRTNAYESMGNTMAEIAHWSYKPWTPST